VKLVVLREVRVRVSSLGHAMDVALIFENSH
jgi:hypothetical protein